MANKKFFISTLSAILFCLFFCLACFFPQGFTQGGTIDYLITLIASFCLFFWGITMVYRTQYKKQRIILLCIFVISFLWISIRFVKWLANMHFISIYADYFYYIPMTVIPLLFFILVAETFCPKFKHKKVVYSTLISIVLTFIILAFSNNLHNLIYKNYNFSYSETNPNIEIITYDYNYMHFAMLGFVLLLNISTISLFFWGTAKQITFKQIFISSLFIVLLFVYILLYTFNTWHIKNIIILKDFALVVVIFLNAILETLLDVGLIQNNGRYEQNFKNSNLPMCIFDENEKILFVSKKFENSNNKHLKQKTKNIGAYKLVVQEDLTELDNLQQKIKTENKELESINQMLEKLIKINSEQSKLAHKLAYIDEIEHGIARQKKNLKL